MADEVTVATVDGQPLRARFPLHVELFGVEAVVIPEAEYDALRAKAASEPAPFRLRPKSPIDNDPEVAEFLATSLPRMIVAEALVECRKRFGPKRTPSRSAVSRFRQRLSRGASIGKAAREIP